MNVLFVVPPYILKDKYLFSIPLGLLQMAGQLKPYGYNLELIDFILYLRNRTVAVDENLHRTCGEILMNKNPDVIGFTTVSLSYPTVLNIAKECKKINPDVKIVLGGPQATVTHFETLSRFPFIDFIVRREGDFAIIELLQEIKNKSENYENIPGLSYINSDKTICVNEDRPLITDLNTLELPDYSIIPDMSEYRSTSIDGKLSGLVDSGRGCAFNCSFCSSRLIWERRARYKSIERVFQEIDILLNDKKADEIYLVHDLFTAKRSYVVEFCNKILDENRKFEWHCRGRVDTVDQNLLELMRKAGCTKVVYGIESGSPRILKEMNKKINLSKVNNVINISSRLGFAPTNFFILGYPSETYQDLEESLQLMAQSYLITGSKPATMILSPLSKTDVYNKYKDTLTLVLEHNKAEGINFINNRPIDCDLKLIKEDPVIFSSFYNIIPEIISLDFIFQIQNYFFTLLELYVNTILSINRIFNIPIYKIFKDYLKYHSESLQEGFKMYLNKEIPKDDHRAIIVNEIYKYETIVAQINEGQYLESSGDKADITGLPDEKFMEEEYYVSDSFKLVEFKVDILKLINALKDKKEIDSTENNSRIMFIPFRMGCTTVKLNNSVVDIIQSLKKYRKIKDYWVSVDNSWEKLDSFKKLIGQLISLGVILR